MQKGFSIVSSDVLESCPILRRTIFTVNHLSREKRIYSSCEKHIYKFEFEMVRPERFELPT